MKVVQPVPVTDAILVASSVAETDFPAWAVGSTYGLGDRVISTATHRIYESAVSGNAGQDPAGAGAASWIDVGPTHRWAMFDQAVGSLTSAAASLEVSLHPGVVVDTLAVLDVTGSSVRVQVSVGGSIVHDETRNVTEGGRTATTLVFSDLPRDASAELTVTLTGTGTVSVGTLIIGRAFDLGETEAAPTISLTDYSRRETDEFGITTVVERSWAKRLSVRVKIETAAIDEVQRRIAALRATPALWIGQDEPGILTAYGFFRDFSLDLQLPGVSYCSLTIESLPTSEVLDDATLDPAPAGQASTLKVIQSTPVTGGMLLSSSVVENDYSEWSAATNYSAGSRVIKAATHRIYESLIADNAGNDPAGAGASSWIDIAPTNRWAMFDQALGSVTTDTSVITVTIAPAADIDAVALLDIDALAVRVEAPGYDQTKSTVVDGMKITSVSFLDLPGVSGDVTVTLTGAGAVSVGTLIIGRIAAMGLTEDTPSVGITDFSRKETDEFGLTVPVERAWAKRMTVRSLVDSGAVEDVLSRIAALRAKPSLWIGDEGFDSLTIYGFFRDFSIELGDNVSVFGLTVEGLTTAGAFSRNGTRWTDIVDDDPAHPKPEDGATIGAPEGTPVGGVPAEELVATMEENKQKVTDTLAQLGAAQLSIQELVDTYGYTASAAASADAALQFKGLAEQAKTDAEAAAQSSAGSAGASAQSATVASGFADDAGVSATVAQGTLLQAKTIAASLLPSDFSQDGLFWTNGFTGNQSNPPPINDDYTSFVSIPGIGKVAQLSGDGTASTYGIAHRGFQAVQSGRIYQLSARVRIASNNTINADTRIRLYLEAYSSAYGLVGGFAVENALAPTLNEWIVLDGAFTGEEILAAGSGVGAYFKGLVRVESTLGNTDAVMQTHYLRIDDVTESTAAGNSAQIAQTASATVTDLAAQVQDNKNLTAQYLDATESAKNEAVAASGTAVTASQDAAAAVTTATQKATAAGNSATISSEQATIATDAAAAAEASAILAASTSGGAASAGLVSNANFGDYPSDAANARPPGWALYGSPSLIQRVTGNSTSPYGVLIETAANVAGGLYHNFGSASLPTISYNQWVVLEADIQLNSGTLEGAGLLFYTLNAANQSGNNPGIDFSTDKDTTGVAPGNGQIGKLYTFRKLVRVTDADAVFGRIYLMNAYANFGSIAGANGIIWYHADVRYATDAEIASGEIPNIQASVMAQAGAITDLEGRTESYLKLSTIAGQNVAEIMAGATGTGSVIGLRAKHIRLGDENLVAMDVSGGKVQFYGDVQVGSLPVQDYSNMIPDAGLTDINNWVSDGQPGWAFVTETTLGWSNSRAVRFSGTYTDAWSNYYSGLDTPHFPVTPGETYLVSCDIDPNSGATGTIAVATAFFNSSGADAGGGSGINYANAQSAAKQHISFFVTAPALATTAFFRIRRGSASGSGDTLSGTIYIGNITFRRAANTDMIPDDAITGPKLIANAVTAGHINVANLQAISATIGILRTASSGQRQEIRDNAIKVFDAANVLRMQSGNLAI